MEIRSWEGQEENTYINYEVCDTNEEDIIAPPNSISCYDFENEIRADKWDNLIAASSGILTLLLDVFWVGEFSLIAAQDSGINEINKFVISLANSSLVAAITNKECKKTDLKGCIKFLEENFPMASDKLTNDFGGGLQHHLRDFSHHASPFGLICSILNQFTRKGYGTNKEGKISILDIPETDALGTEFEEKIMLGVVHWIFHLVSDMAGSSGSSGKGTGIPGPLLSFLKILSTMPIFEELKIQYKDDDVAFSIWISKLFNGTAFEHSNVEDRICFDLRTELGMSSLMVKQSIPVIMNQCLVRSFYFIRRLACEYSEQKITSLQDCRKLELRKFLPIKNRCIVRMTTIATGVFTAVDSCDAMVRARTKKIENNNTMLVTTVLHLNFSGICSFVFAIKNEVQYGIKDIQKSYKNKEKIKNEMLAKATKSESLNIEGKCKMDNSKIYELAFKCMYKNVKETKERIVQSELTMETIQRPIFAVLDDNTKIYNAVIRSSEHSMLVENGTLVMRLFKSHNITFDSFDEVKEKQYNMPFALIEDGKRIAYLFTTHLTERIEYWEKLKNRYNIDGIKVVALVNMAQSQILWDDGFLI